MPCTVDHTAAVCILATFSRQPLCILYQCCLPSVTQAKTDIFCSYAACTNIQLLIVSQEDSFSHLSVCVLCWLRLLFAKCTCRSVDDNL